MKKMLIVFLALGLIGAAFGLAACETFEAEVTVAQAGDEQTISVCWETDEEVDRAIVTVEHGGQSISRTVFEGKSVENKSVEVAAIYGNLTVQVDLYHGARNCHVEQTVSLTAPEYNFAPLSGTMPVLLFTLSLDEITAEGEIPTFVWLARPDAWDWNRLPVGVYAMPNATREEVTQHENYNLMVAKTAAYIRELAEADPASRFNLYINDYNAYLYPQMLLAQNVQNYTVTLLSDGTASYNEFNGAFNVENPSAVYESMREKFAAFREEVAGDERYPNDTYSIGSGELRAYCYVMAREYENIDWWLTRLNGTLQCGDEAFLAEAKTYIAEKNIGTMLASLDEAEQAELKTLYHFGDEMFGAAELLNKKVMIFLGTHLTSQENFIEYAKYAMDYYGDDYVYYYKGHPATPTGLYPQIKKEIEALGIIDLESSIAAELILFFYPDVYLCGYPSSTYLSVTEEEMACGLFGVTEEGAAQYEYCELMEFYIAPIEAHGERYASLIADPSHRYFIAEFSADDTFDLYDATAGTAVRYRAEGDAFVPVK